MFSRLGVHFAITDEQAQELLDAGNDEALVAIVKEEIEEAWDEENLFQTSNAWDAIHRSLSDGTLNRRGGEPPLNKCIFGGRVLNQSDDYFVVLLNPDEVREVSIALSTVTKEWLREKYFGLEFKDYKVEKSEEDWEYTWSLFEGLPDFFAKAGNSGRHVIFTVDPGKPRLVDSTTSGWIPRDRCG